jgi:hypothetical protein
MRFHIDHDEPAPELMDEIRQYEPDIILVQDDDTRITVFFSDNPDKQD